MTAVEVGSQQFVVGGEHVVDDSLGQEVVRHESVEGVAAVGRVVDVCILGIHVVIHLLGVCLQVVEGVDAVFCKHVVGLDESCKSEVALFHVEHVVVLLGRCVAVAFVKRVGRAVVCFVDVFLHRVLHAREVECRIE